MRALWDYYKINGVIESKYCQLKKGGDQEGRVDGWVNMSSKIRRIVKKSQVELSVRVCEFVNP